MTNLVEAPIMVESELTQAVYDTMSHAQWMDYVDSETLISNRKSVRDLTVPTVEVPISRV